MEAKTLSERMPFSDWRREVGISRATGWRYRKRGWIAAINRAGRLYVTREEHERFRLRERRGEFAIETGRALRRAGGKGKPQGSD